MVNSSTVENSMVINARGVSRSSDPWSDTNCNTDRNNVMQISSSMSNDFNNLILNDFVSLILF